VAAAASDIPRADLRAAKAVLIAAEVAGRAGARGTLRGEGAKAAAEAAEKRAHRASRGIFMAPY